MACNISVSLPWRLSREQDLAWAPPVLTNLCMSADCGHMYAKDQKLQEHMRMQTMHATVKELLCHSLTIYDWRLNEDVNDFCKIQGANSPRKQAMSKLLIKMSPAPIYQLLHAMCGHCLELNMTGAAEGLWSWPAQIHT